MSKSSPNEPKRRATFGGPVESTRRATFGGPVESTRRATFGGPVDRATLRMITLKRFVTGTASLVFAVGLAAFGLVRGDLLGTSRLLWALAIFVFAFGGSWSLRDAFRCQKLLRDSRGPSRS